MRNEERILDANANRAREGLRVVEEYARFILDAPVITNRLKALRHNLVAALASLSDPDNLTQARDTAGDVGSIVTTPSEGSRADSREVARASIRRLEESLRVLEEYGKILSPETGARFEAIRYEAYEIEALLFADPDRRERLAKARLYVIITDALASADALTTARECAAGGADIIQMREKEMEDGEFLSVAEEMNTICREHGTLFIINDRPHIASLIDADGIHTGQGDLPVHLVRKLIGRDHIIGKSTSGPEFLQKAFEDGADYVGVGPVFPTNTKQHRAAAGLGYVQHAAEYAKLPYFAIGSVNRDSLDAVLEAGARSIAVCTAIIGAQDIAAETAWFKRQLI
ncbi:MAG: thiamine phosphate synthase [Planctomycetota bacterium]|jgi:thiamine-phosphate pyrophosphorylase